VPRSRPAIWLTCRTSTSRRSSERCSRTMSSWCASKEASPARPVRADASLRPDRADVRARSPQGTSCARACSARPGVDPRGCRRCSSSATVACSITRACRGRAPPPLAPHLHRAPLTDEQEAADQTRFYRWHLDAALYKLHPPKVTTLLALQVPENRPQTVVYGRSAAATRSPFRWARPRSCRATGRCASCRRRSATGRCVRRLARPHPYV